jgi:hypothetical protein
MKVISNFVSNGFRKVAFGKYVIIGLILTVAKGAKRRAGAILF